MEARKFIGFCLCLFRFCLLAVSIGLSFLRFCPFLAKLALDLINILLCLLDARRVALIPKG